MLPDRSRKFCESLKKLVNFQRFFVLQIDSCFHLTSIFLSCEVVDFCSEKSSNQIGIENQGVKSLNILNILYISGKCQNSKI